MEYSRHLYYLIGSLRDGGVYKSNRNYTIVWYSNSLEYLKSQIVKRLKLMGYNPRLDEYKSNHYRVRIYSRKFFDIVVKEFEHPINTGGKRVPWKTPGKVTDALLGLKLEYIKGFVDAEGSVIYSKKGVQIDVSQQIKEPLEFLAKTLNILGIRTTGIYLGKDGIWRLRIASKDNLIRFASIIGFRHPSKSSKLLKLLKLCACPQPSKLKGIGGGAPQGVEPAA